jgi:hypothetical protein
MIHLRTGLTVKHLDNQESEHEDSNEIVTRIEVDSPLYNFDVEFQNVTLDTEYSNWQNNALTKMLKNLYN